ncbi:MAG: superoxide dismutase family protein [Proteobacteria bacterium]|nr:superoxide dismutase family protein [Pseudomonadota bacterium]
MRAQHLLAAIGVLSMASCSTAAQFGSSSSITVPMALVTATGAGSPVGYITLRNGAGGVALALHLRGLPAGDHGFHLHGGGSCAPGANPAGEMIAAGGAGSHLDPANSGHHEGPSGQGHLGDLPVLHVGSNGTASQVLVAPRLRSIDELRGHALIIHAGGDNYSDTPAPLGGGGVRIACGVVS